MNRHNIIVQNLELAKLSKANFEPLARDRCLGDRNFLVHTAQELVRSNTSLLSFSVALQVRKAAGQLRKRARVDVEGSFPLAGSNLGESVHPIPCHRTIDVFLFVVGAALESGASLISRHKLDLGIKTFGLLKVDKRSTTS